jgi:hypothetical protein
VDSASNFGLAAIGRSGGFTVEVLSRREGGWLLSVDAPNWCCYFDLNGPASVADLAQFLQSHVGREEFAENVIGTLGGMPIRVVKDDESADRIYLRAAGGRSLVEFTLTGADAQAFKDAMVEASGEFQR